MIIDSQNIQNQNSNKLNENKSLLNNQEILIYSQNNNYQIKDSSTNASSKEFNSNFLYTNKSIVTNQIDYLTLNNNNKISSIINIYFDNEKESIQSANEYLDEIYFNLLKEEKELNKVYGYMDNQPDINEEMRAILIDWLIEVHLRFHLKEQTLYITIGIIDIYLSSKIIQRSKLQLLGITALLIACKSQEIYYPPIKDFIDITDKAYEKKELIQMEYYVLSILNFKILFPTACDFYDIISQIYHFNSQQYFLGKYFMECALIDYRMTKYHSSILACSCGYLVMKYFGIKNYKMMYEPLMSNEIAPQKIVKQCGKEICILIRGLKKTSLKATREKYSLNEFEKVSELCDVEN